MLISYNSDKSNGQKILRDKCNLEDAGTEIMLSIGAPHFLVSKAIDNSSAVTIVLWS